jgi:hypothetical protein
MTTNTTHRLRRTIAVAAGLIALAGASTAAFESGSDAAPAPAGTPAAQATTAWIAAQR